MLLPKLVQCIFVLFTVFYLYLQDLKEVIIKECYFKYILMDPMSENITKLNIWGSLNVIGTHELIGNGTIWKNQDKVFMLW